MKVLNRLRGGWSGESMNEASCSAHLQKLSVICLALLALFMLNSCTFAADTTAPLPGVTAFQLSPAPVLGIVIDQEMKIISVESDSAAEQAGLQVGDILKSIHSKFVSNPLQARQIFYDSNLTIKMRFTIMRDGNEIPFEILPKAPNGSARNATVTPIPSGMIYS